MGRLQIERCVPHAGAMVLLDSVTQWDSDRIACRAAAPDALHPLARGGVVPALSAAEYAAQAAAVHGFLLQPDAGAREGMLAKLTDVELHSDRIPHDQGPLTISALLISRLASGCIYQFDVGCGDIAIARGRMMLAFTDAER